MGQHSVFYYPYATLGSGQSLLPSVQLRTDEFLTRRH